MEGINSMKIIRLILAVVLIAGLSSLPHQADGGTAYKRSTSWGSAFWSYRGSFDSCGLEPHMMRWVEDGLALVLDLPLALLSPITCPIVTPIMDKIDPVEKRSFRHYRSGK